MAPDISPPIPYFKRNLRIFVWRNIFASGSCQECELRDFLKGFTLAETGKVRMWLKKVIDSTSSLFKTFLIFASAQLGINTDWLVIRNLTGSSLLFFFGFHAQSSNLGLNQTHAFFVIACLIVFLHSNTLQSLHGPAKKTTYQIFLPRNLQSLCNLYT